MRPTWPEVIKPKLAFSARVTGLCYRGCFFCLSLSLPRPLHPSPFLVRQLGWGVGGGRTEGGVEFRPLSLPRNLTATELSSAQKDIYFNAL